MTPILSPAAKVAARADALWTEESTLTFATDAYSVRGAVLVAIRRKTCSCVLAIPMSQWNWPEVMELLGFEPPSDAKKALR